MACQIPYDAPMMKEPIRPIARLVNVGVSGQKKKNQRTAVTSPHPKATNRLAARSWMRSRGFFLRWLMSTSLFVTFVLSVAIPAFTSQPPDREPGSGQCRAVEGGFHVQEGRPFGRGGG